MAAEKMGGKQAADREVNNHPQGRSGSGTPTKPGPARGKTKGNPVAKKGIVGDR